jgi:hypothetical protein
MTFGWVIFGVVMPVIVAGLGWTAVLANERYLRNREKQAQKPAE